MMFRATFVVLLSIFVWEGVWAQSPQEQYLRCIQYGANKTASRLPHSAQQFSEFQIQMNSLESQLNNCKDAACRSATDAEVDAAYFRFVVDDVLTDVSGYEPATDLDVDVNRCSENRSSSLLLLRERSPLWCFFAPVSDLWQNEPEFETNRYATVHNMRVTMTAFRDCNSRQECIDGVINVGENVYFSFYQHLLLSSEAEGNELATRANGIVRKCVGRHRTKVEDFIASPIFCQQAAGVSIRARFPNLALFTNELFQSFNQLLTDFWLCDRNRTCTAAIAVKAEASYQQYIAQIRPQRYGTDALVLATTVIDNCRREQSNNQSGGQGGNGQGNQGGNQGQTPARGNSTIECFRSAIEQIPQHAPHLINSRMIADTRTNLEEIQNVWRRCNGSSAAVCQANADATANNIYFHTISNLFLEVQGIEVANLTDRAVNACNGRRPTRVTPMIESSIWCYLLAAANVSRNHPDLDFYVQDLVKGLQVSITNYANCEFSRRCKMAAVDGAGRLYEEFARRIRLHSRGGDVIAQSNSVYTTCLRSSART